MDKYTKTLIAALGAVTMVAFPAAANADRAYFLVGMRHIYRIGALPYAKVEERQRIEQDYADQVAADQDAFNKAVAEGVDPKEESPKLNAALDDLADERDKELMALYPNADWVRQRQPELIVESDGPYQVVGVDFHMEKGFSKFDSYTVLKPWPDYPIEEYPYGWRYNMAFSPAELHRAYEDWSGHFAPTEVPIFVGLYGTSEPVIYEIQVVHEYRFVREYHRHHVHFENTGYDHGHGSLRQRHEKLPPRVRSNSGGIHIVSTPVPAVHDGEGGLLNPTAPNHVQVGATKVETKPVKTNHHTPVVVKPGSGGTTGTTKVRETSTGSHSNTPRPTNSTPHVTPPAAPHTPPAKTKKKE